MNISMKSFRTTLFSISLVSLLVLGPMASATLMKCGTCHNFPGVENPINLEEVNLLEKIAKATLYPEVFVDIEGTKWLIMATENYNEGFKKIQSGMEVAVSLGHAPFIIRSENGSSTLCAYNVQNIKDSKPIGYFQLSTACTN